MTKEQAEQKTSDILRGQSLDFDDNTWKVLHGRITQALLDCQQEAVPKTRRIVKSDLVRCPVCGEPDMHKEEDADGNALIHCVNHACASNGGSNSSVIQQEAVKEAVDLMQKTVTKLDAIHRATSGVFVLAAVHGREYEGPNWTAEYAALTDFIKKLKGGECDPN
jgi:hypothetical protein